MMKNNLLLHTIEICNCKLLNLYIPNNNIVAVKDYVFDIEINKKIFIALTAQEITMCFQLQQFPRLHRFLLLAAMRGNLFLSLSRMHKRYQHSPLFRIESKRWDRQYQQFSYIILSKRKLRMHFLALDLLFRIDLLQYLSTADVADIVQTVRNNI